MSKFLLSSLYAMISRIFLALFAMIHPKIFSKSLAHKFKQFLKLEAEASLFQLFVFVEIESVEVGFAFGRGPYGFVQLRENVQVEHLFGEVAPVEMYS